MGPMPGKSMSTMGQKSSENRQALGAVKKISAKTPKRLHTSIRFDTVNPGDYLKYDFRSSCEDCTHFNRDVESCTLGYESKWHRKEFQTQSFELSGKMALCRFLEID
jgi:hypothetical protein